MTTNSIPASSNDSGKSTEISDENPCREDQHPVCSPEECTESGCFPTEGENETGCPPPLPWKSVVEKVRAESEPWEHAGHYGILRGRIYGNGSPLYFLKGMLGNWELFSLTMWLLRDDFCCVVVEDLESKQPASLDEFAAEVLSFAESQNHGQINVFATSVGSLLAFHLLAANPGTFEKAVIHAGMAKLELSVVERLLVTVSRMIPGGLSRLPMFQRVQEVNHRCWFPPFDHTRWNFYAENVGQASVRSLSRKIRSYRNSQVASFLPEIQQPVRLLGTEGEGNQRRLSREHLQDVLPCASTEVLPILDCSLI